MKLAPLNPVHAAFSAAALALTLSFSALASAETSAQEEMTLYPPVEMGAVSQQIPAGMKMRAVVQTPLDTRTSRVGDPFVVSALEDMWAGEQLILPKGTVVRGRVDDVDKAGYFSKGGLMRLTFDHIQMPSGELRPLSLRLDAASAKMNSQKGALYTDPGIGVKLDNSVDKGIDKFKEFHEKGMKAGEGAGKIITVPAGAIAGVATGTAVTTVNAAKSIFGKGEPVVLAPGDQLLIDFSQAATLQAQ